MPRRLNFLRTTRRRDKFRTFETAEQPDTAAVYTPSGDGASVTHPLMASGPPILSSPNGRSPESAKSEFLSGDEQITGVDKEDQPSCVDSIASMDASMGSSNTVGSKARDTDSQSQGVAIDDLSVGNERKAASRLSDSLFSTLAPSLKALLADKDKGMRQAFVLNADANRRAAKRSVAFEFNDKLQTDDEHPFSQIEEQINRLEKGTTLKGKDCNDLSTSLSSARESMNQKNKLLSDFQIMLHDQEKETEILRVRRNGENTL